MAVAGAIVLGLIGLGSVANATDPHFGNIDPDATGSITVHKHETGSQTPDGTPDGKTAVNGTPVADVTFTFFQLVNLDMTSQAGWEGWDSFTVPADACGDGNSPNLTLPNGDSGVFILRGDEVTKADGTATMDNLPVAVYLVCETDSPASVIHKAAPTLVTIPFPNTSAEAANGDGTWLYDVHVYPKNTVVQAPDKGFTLNASGIKTGAQVEFPVTVKVPSLASRPAEQYFSYFVISDPLETALSDGAVKSVTITPAGGSETEVPAENYDTTSGQTPSVVFNEAGLTYLKGQPNATITVTFTATVNEVPASGTIANTGYFYVDTRTVPGTPDTPDEDKKVPTNEVISGWGDVKVSKVDADNGTTGLKGAKFRVYASSDPFADTCTTATKTGTPIAVDGVTEFESDASGMVNIKGLFVDSKIGPTYNVGDPKPTTALDHTTRCYVLEEITAPVGFVLPSGGQELTAVKITAGQTAGTDVTIKNSKQGVPELPLTGAAGQVLMMIGGVSLVLLAGGSALVARSRRRRAES